MSIQGKLGEAVDLQSMLRESAGEVVLVSLDIVGDELQAVERGSGAGLYQGRSVLVYGKNPARACTVIEAIRQGARGFVCVEVAVVPAPAPVQPPHRLSMREVQVIERISQGKTNGEIGIELGIAESTVKFHSQQVFARLKVRNRAEAVMSCLREGHIR